MLMIRLKESIGEGESRGGYGRKLLDAPARESQSVGGRDAAGGPEHSRGSKLLGGGYMDSKHCAEREKEILDACSILTLGAKPCKKL